MVVDGKGAIFDDRRKNDRRKKNTNIKETEERRKNDRRKQNQ